MTGPLVSVDWLREHLDEVSVVDCRWALGDPAAGRIAHGTAHIPGAVYASLDDDLSDLTKPNAGRHPLPDREVWIERVGRLGISRDRPVVAYDDAGGAYASRLWWMLRWVGHESVAVLDGGWQTWTAAGGATEAGVVTPSPVAFDPGETTMPFVDRGDVAVRPPDTILLDARDPSRYRGETEPMDPAAGHIPGASNAPFADNLTGGSFREVAELRDRFAALGVGEGETIVYCGSGVTACHDVLAIELAGLGTATLYPGSWSDWSTAGGEVATG